MGIAANHGQMVLWVYMKFSSLGFYFLYEVGSKGNLSLCGAFWVIPQGLILNSIILLVPNLLFD